MSGAIVRSIFSIIPTGPRDEGLIVGIVEVLRSHTGPIAYSTLRNVIQGARDEFILDLTLLIRAGVVTRTAAGRFKISDDARRGMLA